MDIGLSGNVHLVAGGREMVERVLETLGQTGMETRGNPDIFIREYLQFGIEDARDVRGRAGSRAVKERARVFILVAFQMTDNAQNALLKTLEEPTADALFFLITPSPETLLPTLRSRAQILSVSGGSENVDTSDFLAATPARRIEMLKPLIPNPKEKEERDVGAIIAFLSSLERELEQAGAEKAKEGIEAIYRARKYIADKGSLLKSLLEQVALLVPKV